MQQGTLRFVMIRLFLSLIIVLLFGSLASATVYYASPSGSGDGNSQSTPFQIADFWDVASPGDTLYLLDGTYTGSNSMLDPPDDVDGTSNSYITIAAMNEGNVLIDGQYSRHPVRFVRNSYYNIEGINAKNGAKNVFEVEHSSHHLNFKRCIGWDAHPEQNDTIFGQANSSYILFEDCAGWGTARKIFASYMCDHITYRRCFFRWSGYTGVQGRWQYTMGMSWAYGSSNTLIENCIGTWDETGFDSADYLLKDGIFGVDHSFSNGGYEQYGNIAYFLDSQEGSTNAGAVYTGADTDSNLTQENFLIYIEHENSACMELNMSGVLTYGTFIGGGKGTWSSDAITIYTTDSLNYLISKDSSTHGINNGNYSNYVLFYNNSYGNYRNGEPNNYKTENPSLIEKCGNILQYGLEEENRPKVDGQSVGAKIQYRYVDGSLTGTELWPWPMNDRIAEAMVDSGYNNKGGLDGNGATDLTNVVFTLDGGTEPSWNGTATYQCNDGIDNDGDGLIDLNDPGCESSTDDNEENSLANGDTHSGDSGNLDSNHPVEHLWDGNTSSDPAYSTGAGDIASFYVEFDLGELYNLTEARLFGDAGGNWISETWDLEYKQESGDSYSTAFSGQNCLGNQWYIETFDVTARYVKVTVHGDDSYPATQACELQLYGAAGDTGAPTRSNGSPSGTLQCTTGVTMSLDTNEQAICKYDTSSGTAYDSMANTFSSTNSTSHSQSIGTSCDTSYTYYVRCKDSSDSKNTDDYEISWTVAADAPPETVGNVLGLNVEGISFQ